MIDEHNLNIPEEDYRDLDLPSCSMLASISKHGIDVVDGVKNNKFELKFGSLVDVMCFETDTLKDRFYLGDSIKNPTQNVKKIIDEVLSGINSEIGEEQIDDGFLRKKKRKITNNLEDYKREILLATKKIGVYSNYTDEKIMKSVLTGKEYFKDKLTSRGKMLIKPEMWNKAYETANTLVTHPFSSKCFDHSDPEVKIYYQFKFISEVNGRKTKGMLDCVIVNHREKTITPIDLKTGESPASKFNEVILIHRYYIQGALYKEALRNIVSNDPDLSGYVVEDFEFLYISKMNVYKPLIWVMPESFHKAALHGFKDVFGYSHDGVYDLLEDYYNCKDGMFCQYTREVYENEGRIMLDGIIDEKIQDKFKTKQE